jgi:hypothetical protein
MGANRRIGIWRVAGPFALKGRALVFFFVSCLINPFEAKIQTLRPFEIREGSATEKIKGCGTHPMQLMGSQAALTAGTLRDTDHRTE